MASMTRRKSALSNPRCGLIANSKSSQDTGEVRSWRLPLYAPPVTFTQAMPGWLPIVANPAPKCTSLVYQYGPIPSAPAGRQVTAPLPTAVVPAAGAHYPQVRQRRFHRQTQRLYMQPVQAWQVRCERILTDCGVSLAGGGDGARLVRRD